MTKSDLETFSLCEWIGQYFLPNFYSNLNIYGYNDMFEFLNQFEQKEHNVSYFSTKNCLLKFNNSVIDDLAEDLRSNLKLCYKIESNLFYFEWILSLFEPLLYCLLTLFLLPSLVIFLLYASSFFLYITKHWSKLKVSHSYACINLFNQK